MELFLSLFLGFIYSHPDSTMVHVGFILIFFASFFWIGFTTVDTWFYCGCKLEQDTFETIFK